MKPLTPIEENTQEEKQISTMRVRERREEKQESWQGMMTPVKMLLVYDWPTALDATERSSRVKTGSLSLGLEFKRTADEVVSVV